MDLKKTLLLLIMLAVVILLLPLGPILSVALIILLGMIALGVNKMKKTKEDQSLPISNPPGPAGAPLLPDDADGKSESSPTPSSSSRFKYDVYLNFVSDDTGNRIADHLYGQLNDAELRVFSQTHDLTPGKEIWPEIKGAIERSRISIAIFSKIYACRRSCLGELEEMWKCRKTNGQTIIPIFYDVDPRDVGLQTDLFSDQLRHFDRDFDSNTREEVRQQIKTWEEILQQIAKIKGFSLDNRYGHEGHFVKEVIERVKQLLKEDYQFVDDKLVGIDHHVQEMMKKLGVDYRKGQEIEVQGEEVRVVGICGVPGVGKTTLAKAVFHKMRKLFDAHSFLEDIRLKEVQFSRDILIANLKKQITAPLESSSEDIASLCRGAKVLIVLDGVDKEEQIKALAGKLTWFGPGSRIIVTTNQRNVLKAFDVGAVEEHAVKPMDQGHAHKLFCKHAFRGDAAQDVSEYFGLSIDIAKAIGGLPSAIVHQASSLHDDMNIVRWKTTLNLLKKKHKK